MIYHPCPKKNLTRNMRSAPSRPFRSGKVISASRHGVQRRSPVTTMSTSWLPQREQISRLCQSATGVIGAVSSRHFGGIGLDLMAAFPERQQDRAGLGASVPPK